MVSITVQTLSRDDTMQTSTEIRAAMPPHNLRTCFIESREATFNDLQRLWHYNNIVTAAGATVEMEQLASVATQCC